MVLFEILKTVLQILKTVLQSLKQCFKFGGVVQTIKNQKTDIAGDDGLHLPEEIKTGDVELHLPKEINTFIAGDGELHLPEEIKTADGELHLPEEVKTFIAGDIESHLPEKIKTFIAGDVELHLPEEIKTYIAGDVELHLPEEIKTADGGLHLPEEIIQRIQSFLNGKEAARTTLLSKLWRSAWSTRPNLDYFDEDDFQESNEAPNLQATEQLLQFAKKNMQRYDDLKLNIETFRLHINNKLLREEERESRYLSLSNELTEKAMKLRAVGFDINIKNRYFVLPDSVLRSETLARLSLTGFFTFDFKRLTYSKIKSLSLSLVHVEGLSSDSSDEFPNLEYMYMCFFTRKGSFLNDASFFSRFSSLKELVFSACSDWRNIRICSKSLERITMITSSRRNRKVISAEFDVPNLRRFKLELKDYEWTRLAFKGTCREWESDVCLLCFDTTYIGVDWLSNLNKLLTDLSMSRSVSLSIYFIGEKPTNWCGGLVGTAGLPTPGVVIKELKLDLYKGNATFLDNFFLICRPKLIILEKYRSSRELIAENLWELICKGIVEEVKVEVWERASQEWRCGPLINHRRHDNIIANNIDDHNSTRLMFVNALIKTFRFQTLRVQLRWGKGRTVVTQCLLV